MDHRDSCPALASLQARFPEPYTSLTSQERWLQVDLPSASILQCVLAFTSVVSRLRRLLLDGKLFFSVDDLVLHAKRLCADPWIPGSPVSSDRQERRQFRSRPPVFAPDAFTCASDGAARNQGTGSPTLASSGSVRYQPGVRRIAACLGRFLGDVTSNYCEYEGLLECLRHASEFPAPRIFSI